MILERLQWWFLRRVDRRVCGAFSLAARAKFIASRKGLGRR